MNAYLYAAWINRFRQGQFTDGCSSLILYGTEETAARRYFEERLLAEDSVEPPVLTKIERIVCAPFLDQLLSETGSASIDWNCVCAEAERDLETADLDDFEHGYWVDCNQCVPADNLALSIEALRSALPEEIRSGLNWSPEKTRFYILSVLSPAAPPLESIDFFGEREPGSETESDEITRSNLSQQPAPFPEVVNKELAVLLRARNSAVAAWLWRRHAAGTAREQNALRIDAWCGATACPM